MKKIFALLLAMVMLLSLVACGTTESAPATDAAPGVSGKTDEPVADTPKETVTLQFWGGVPGQYGYDQLVENFNKEFADKGIQVEYTRFVNDDDGNLQLDTYLMGGDGVDVYMGYGGTERLFTRVDAGLALDMTPYLEEAGFDPIAELGENNVAGYTYNDKYYTLPTMYENKNWMVINADMFEAAGIELPLNGWTYAEFEEAAQKLTHGEGQDKVYGIFWNMNGSWRNAMMFVGGNLGKYQTYTDDTATATNMDHELWQRGLQLVVDSQNDGWGVSLDAEMADGLNFNNTFLAGKAAMSSGIYNLRTIKDLETYPHDFETALVPYPVADETYLDQWAYADFPGATDLITINPKSKHIEEALQFVLWYTKGGMVPLASGGRIPLWKGTDPQLVVDELCSIEGVFNEESIKSYLSIDSNKAYAMLASSAESKIATIKKEEMQAALLGQQTVEEACQNMKTRSDELLK